MAARDSVDLNGAETFAAEGFYSGILPQTQPASRVDAVRVAQATASAPPATIIVELEDGNIARLPAGADISNISANGADLQFVQPDGTVIVITGGAIANLVLFIGDIQIPAEAVELMFTSNNIETAAGPEGGTDGAHGGFVDPTQQTVGPGGQFQENLENTELPDGTFGGAEQQATNFAPVILSNAGGNLSEEGLSGGITDTTGSPDTTDSPSLSGQIVVSDVGPLTFAFQQPTGTYTSGGQPITWQVNGGTILGVVGNTTVFTGLIDQTGNWSVTLSGPFDHPTGQGENTLPLILDVLVTDTGGLSTPTTLTFILEDDMPVLTATEIVAGYAVTLDETNAGFPMSVTSANSVLAYTNAFGADGAATLNGTVYGLSLTNANGTTSLATAIGDYAITLVATSPTTIAGQYQNGGTQTAFTVTIGTDGKLTVTQSVALEHTTDGTNASGAHNDILTLSGLITATVTLTDKDGDSTSGSTQVGGKIAFYDDGPAVDISANQVSVVLDESATTSNIAWLINTGIYSKGNDPDVSGSGYLARTISSGAIVDTTSLSYGADGAAASGAKVYTLSVDTAASGLTLTDGTAINLVLTGGVVVGVVAGNGTFGGQAAFAISIDSATGIATTELYLSLKHPDQASALNNYISLDEAVQLATGTVGVTVTVTDSDGDTASDKVDVSKVFSFKDDGPNATDDGPGSAGGDFAATEGESAQQNLILAFDVSGSMGDGDGSNNYGSRLDLAKAAAIQLINSSDALQVRVVTFSDNATTSAWLNKSEAIAYINSNAFPGPDDSTDYVDGLNAIRNAYGNSQLPGDTSVYFFTDGQPSGNYGTALTNFNSFLTTYGIESFVVGAGTGLNNPDGDMQAIASDPDGSHIFYLNGNNQLPFSSLVASLANQTAAAKGNVLTDGTDDTFGSDGGSGVHSITVNGTTYTAANATNNVLTVVTTYYGTLVFNLASGAWSYYAPSNVDNSAATRNDGFSYTIKDGDGDTDSATVGITLTAVNDAPIVVGSSAVGYTENAAGVVINSTLTLSDEDNSSLVGAKVTITNFVSGQDVLTFINQNGITGSFNSANGVLTLSGSATVAQYQAALRSVTYSNSSDAPSTTARSVTFQVDDGQAANHASNIVTSTVNVTAVNDEPVATITPATYTVNEQTNLPLHGTGLSVSDVDAGNSSISITLSVGTGIITVSVAGTGASIGSGNGTGSVTINGTVAQLNALLAGSNGGSVVYNANTDAPPSSTTLTLLVNDTGDTGTGGAKTHSDTATINLTPVNDTPDISIPTGSGDFSDNFSPPGYGGNDGSRNFTGDWVETGDNSSSSSGEIQVDDSQLQFYGPGNGASIERTLDLAGVSTAELTFNYYEDGTESGETLTVQFAADGVNFVTLDVLSESDANGLKTFNLTGPFTSAAKVKFTVSGLSNENDHFAVDNVTVNYTAAASPAYTEQASAVAIMPTMVLADPDNPANFNGGSLTVGITGGSVAGDSLTFLGGASYDSGIQQVTVGGSIIGTVAGYGGTTLTFNFNANATDARIETLMHAIGFSSTSDNPGTSRTVLVTFNDGGNTGGGALQDTQTITINLTPMNDAPSQPVDNNASANSVAEGAANGTLVGITASSTDLDGPSITYSLTDNAGGRFAINSSTGVVTVANGSLLNFEGASSHNITVQASDGVLTSTQNFTINVSNVAPTVPTDTNGAANAIAEGAANGTVVGVTAASADISGGTITYSLTNNAGGRFAINSNTGVVTVANGALLDFETATSHGITVQASDGNLTNTQSFTINVTDVNEVATAAATINAPSSLNYWSSINTGDMTPINRLSFQDEDSPGVVRVTLQMDDAGDDFDATSSGGVTVTLGGSGGTDSQEIVTLEGTLVAINAYIAAGNIMWNPDDADNGEAGVLTVTVDDNGSSEGGNTTVADINIGEITPNFSNSSSNNFAGVNFNQIDTQPFGDNGSDTMVTSWSHRPLGTETVYNGGNSNDEITLVFTADQLQSILTDSTNRSALDNLLDGDSSNLDLGDTSWNAEVVGFEDAKLGLAAGPSGYVVYTPADSSVGIPNHSGDTDLTGDNNDTTADLVTGTSGNDAGIHGGIDFTDTANNGNDILLGLGGNDILWGGAGADLLLGGEGNDDLHGGNGNDILSGGAGADDFFFSAVGGSHEDYVVDYSFVEGDRIDLSSLLNGINSGNLADHVRVTQSGNDLLIQAKAAAGGAFGATHNVVTIAGYGTAGEDPVKIFIDGVEYTVTE